MHWTIIRYMSQYTFSPMPVRMDTETGVQDKRVRAFEINGNGRPTDLERASDKHRQYYSCR